MSIVNHDFIRELKKPGCGMRKCRYTEVCTVIMAMRSGLKFTCSIFDQEPTSSVLVQGFPRWDGEG